MIEHIGKLTPFMMLLRQIFLNIEQLLTLV